MYYKLESLRGFTACLIVIYHSPFFVIGRHIGLFSNPYFLVDFFFLLSGFVMTLAYSERIKGDLNFKPYMILRLGRIYPMHIVTLFAWLPYVLVKQYLYQSGFGGNAQFATNNLTSFIANVLLLNSMGINDHLSWNYPSWSLSADLFSYIVFYWLTATIDKKNSRLIPIIVSFVCYAILTCLGRPDLDITYDFGFIRCLGAFYLGVFIFRISQSKREPQIIKKYMPAFEIFCIAGAYILMTFSNDFLFFIPAISLLTFSLYIFSSKSSGIIGRFLLTKPLKKIGRWSYSIYMVHALVLAGFSNLFEYILKWNIGIETALGIRALVINTFLLAIIIIISKYSYTYIENIFRLKSRSIAAKYYSSKQTTAKNSV